MNSTQRGGSANISGVVYQTLWCLLRMMQIRVRSPIEADSESEALLVLEPKGGGGDVRVGADVEQLKAKSDGGTWSLQSIISEVLPDLFMAARGDTGSTRFRFVTEGTMGDWTEVYHFFRRLGELEPPMNVLLELDDTVPLKFRTAVRQRKNAAGSSLFQQREYTERAMFSLIADTMKTRPAITSLGLSEVDLHRRLWRLLGGFEFVPSQDRTSVVQEIDRLMLAVVDVSDQIPQIRAAIALSLIELSANGNVSISASELLARHNLAAAPLSQWCQIRTRCHDELQRILANHQYDTRLDVRLKKAESLAASWATSPRTLVITGESGQGKTWRLAGLASCASRGSAPVLWVEGSGNAREDLDHAAHQFWLDMRGGEHPIPLRQIASKLKDVVPTSERLRLRLCIDNVNDYNEASSIVRENWPSLGISVALCCPTELAAALQEAFRDTVFVATSEDFSWEELHDLLEHRIAEAWTDIPGDVRETLRRPLLASIYLEELDAEWRPMHEYELYARMWRRLSVRQQGAFPLDAPRLESLAERVLDGEPYPWTYQRLGPDVDDGALQRLERCGWLTRIDANHIQVFHNRLLNWAVAQSLFSSLQNGNRTVHDFVVQVAELNRRERWTGKVFLGYVPMDVLWLVCGNSKIHAETPVLLLRALEGTFGHQTHVFYRDLVPTLGDRVVGPLFTRFREYEGDTWVLAEIGRTLANLGKTRLASFARELLTSSEPRVQRRGLKLLRETACTDVLDEIWRIHAQGISDPTPFLDDGEQAWMFREDSWPALRESASSDPYWVVCQIKNADPIVEPVHDLAWLIVNLPDGKQSWDDAKSWLFQKVAEVRPRVLAYCIGQFRDVQFIEWLRDRLGEKRDLCGPVAIRSLSRLNAIEAAKSIDKVCQQELHHTSSWSFREVWLREPGEVTKQLLAWGDEIIDPRVIGFLFQHSPDDVPKDVFASMLDYSERHLRQHLEESDLNPNFLYRELSFLAEVISPELTELWGKKRETTFELDLSEYLLRIGGRQGLDRDSLTREPGVRVLRRINGRGFTRLINGYLQCGSRFAKLDAWKWSITAPDEETFQIAAARSQSDELWDGHLLEQNAAIRLLAVHGQWEAAALGVCRCGLQTQLELTTERIVPERYQAEWLNQLRERVKSQPMPGNLIALAFAGNHSDAAELRGILSSNPIDAEMRHACIVGLTMLRDNTDEGIHLVARYLNEHRYSATQMLTRAGTAAAWDALFHDLRSHFDHITALNLMNLSSHADAVLELTTQKLPSQAALGDWQLLRILILRLRPELKRRLLEDDWLRDTFHREAVADEGNFWEVGSKAGAIECLAEFDPKAAYEAAAKALCTVKWHDRERYPYLLCKIDTDRAIPELLDRLESEGNGLVRYSIGRVLSGVILTPVLVTRWESHSAGTRASACFAASWAEDGFQLESNIRRCLDDSSEAVIEAAIEALNRLRQRELARDLCRCAASAEELVVKWRYIDDMIKCIDPGNDFEPWPPTLSSVCKGLSPIVLRLVDDRLKEERKKLHDHLKKEKQDGV